MCGLCGLCAWDRVPIPATTHPPPSAETWLPVRRHASPRVPKPAILGAMPARRDRDSAGRPRQARPRDALGRPLPYDAEGVTPVSEEPLPPGRTLEVARGLVDEGRPFAAHEVLEARWKAAPDEERDLWQGLAQVCVALTHAQRGNAVGAGRLRERGTERLQRYAATGGPTYGLDLAALIACAEGRLGAEGS